jgi:multiple sugar transport system substrate-binding protein
MDHIDELCASLAHGDTSRREFIAKASKAGLGAALTSTLLGIYSPSAEARENAKQLAAMSPGGAFDHKKYAGQKVHLRLSKHPYVDALTPDIAKFKEMTGIDVTYDITPEEQYFDKLKLGLSQKSSDFDVCMVGAYMTWEYGPAGWLEDLKPFMADANKTAPEFDAADIYPNVLKNDSWSGTPGDLPGTGEAKQWALPWGWEINVLTYRQDILKKHNLAVPRSYDEIATVAAKLKTLEPKLIPFLARGKLSWDTIHPGFLSAFNAYGAKDFDKSLKPTMNSPEAVAFTEKFMSILKDSGPPAGRWTGYGVFDMGAAMGAGDVVMYHDATSLGFFQDLPGASKVGGQGKMAWAPSPGKTGPTGSNIWVWSLGLNSGSQSKDAAWLFMQWASGKEHLLYAATQHGHVDTVRKSVFNNPKYQARIAAHVGYSDTFRKQAPISAIYFTPQPLFFTETTNWAGTLQDIYSGKTTAKAGLDKLASDVSNELSQRGITK